MGNKTNQSVMRVSSFLFITFLGCSLFFSCNEISSSKTTVELEEIIPLSYAKGISMYKTSEGTVVTVTNPQTQEILDHFLVSQLEETQMKNIKLIHPNFQSVLAYSSTYISFMSALGVENKITGVTYSQGIRNNEIKKRLTEKKTIDVGSDQSPDKELIVSLHPDLAMIYPSNGNHDWFSSFSIPTITNVEYLEIHPLAQAEWIKLYGVLFNKERLADSLFSEIEKKYLNETSSNQGEKPVILCGELYDDVWTLPGGRSFTSKLIEDAGGIYFLENDTTSGSRKLDFETILSKDSTFDYWLLLTFNFHPITYSYLKENKPRYSYLSIFSTDKISVCNTATSSYFETGILEPHILLKEIKSFIQQKAPEDSLRYFKRLK